MPDAVAIEFESPTGERLAFEWSPEKLASLDPAAAPPEPVWTLGGELDWDELAAVRVLSGRLSDGRLLAIASLRPAAAAGHGDDLVAGVIGSADSFAQLEQPLVSIEYGPDGLARRIGLELYPQDDGLALRIAGDVTAAEASVAGAVRRTASALELRGPDGPGPGAGALDILTPA